MPQVAPAIIGAGAKFLFAVGFSKATAIAISSFVVKTAALTAASSLINAATRPKLASFDDPGRQLQFAPASQAARQVIYGEAFVAGQPVFAKSSGTDREFLDMIIAIGDGGPYEAIDEIYFDDELLTLDGSGNVTSPSKYAGFATIVTTLGSESQSAISEAVSNISEWTTSHTGKGVCHAYVRLKWDPEVWTSGQPTIYFKVRGRKVYDQRLDSTNGGSGTHRKDDPTTWEYSDNRALWLQDYIRGVNTNSIRVIGLGIANALIDWDTIAAAADVCDESVNVSGGGTISRYSGGGGVVTSADDPSRVVNGMLDCFAGEIAPRSGYVAFYAGAARTATVTLSDDDLAGSIKLRTTKSLRDTVNELQALYREPDEGYEQVQAPAYSKASWVTDDGETFRSEINLGFEDDHRRAQRISKIIAARIREPRQLTATWKQKGLQVREGDAFTWSSDRFPAGVTGKYICVNRTINEDGTVQITARSEDDTKYDWDETTEELSQTTGGAIGEPTTAIGLDAIDATAARNAILGALPEYTLRLKFDDGFYDTNTGGALSYPDTVSESLLDDAAVTEAKLGTGAVTEAKLGSAAVTAAKIGTGAVTEAKIGAGAVTEAKLGSTSVTTAKLASSAVETDKIAANAVTNADSTTNTGTRSSASFTEFELVRHTQTLTSGTTALVQIFMNGTDVLAAMGFTISVASGNRDIYLRLIRDPDGTPVELTKVFLRENQGAGPDSYTIDSYGAIYEDTGHGGGSTTYAWVVTSYTAGTTTLNSSTLSHTDITRTIYCLEAKR